jgi:hypothetical protein
MKKISIPLILGYAVSCVTFLCGVAVVAGLVPMTRISPNIRLTFGIVLILWGMYRFVMTQLQRRQRDMEEAEE